MRALRLAVFALLFLGSAAFIYVVASNRIGDKVRPTFAPLFQIAGKPVKLLDRALTKVIPVDELDEKELGEAIAAREQHVDAATSESLVKYLDDAAVYLTQFAKKPFRYRIYVYPSGLPNAFALPGGVIFVTEGLLQTLHSESELIAILAHEMGHIELGHCFESMKFTMLARKMNSEELGRLADLAYGSFLRHTFSKTQENEADEYAFALLTESIYDPKALALSFQRLLDALADPQEDDGRPKAPSVIEEYYATHPTLEMRFVKFSSDADQWWLDKANQHRVIGIDNFRALVSATKQNMEK